MKRAGGLTFAQSPESAKYDGMPRAAIDTGMVDLVLPPAAIGAKLAELGVRGHVPATTFADDHDVPPDNLQRIYDVLQPVSGVDFRHYKLPTIKRRLFRRMALHRITDVGDYLQLLEGNANEARSLYQDLLIHVTRFFRDPDSFVGLAAHVFPAILEGRPAGSADPRLGVGLRHRRGSLFGGDRADRVPAEGSSRHAGPDLRHRRQRERHRVRARRRLPGEHRGRRLATSGCGASSRGSTAATASTKMVRDLCVFARQDLTKDPPFSHLDLILCRNVLIYMDAQLQRKLLSVFHYALNPGGFLVLGQAETRRRAGAPCSRSSTRSCASTARRTARLRRR